MLDHKEAIMSHLLGQPLSGFHMLGLYVHNDGVLAFSTPNRRNKPLLNIHLLNAYNPLMVKIPLSFLVAHSNDLEKKREKLQCKEKTKPVINSNYSSN